MTHHTTGLPRCWQLVMLPSGQGCIQLLFCLLQRASRAPKRACHILCVGGCRVRRTIVQCTGMYVSKQPKTSYLQQQGRRSWSIAHTNGGCDVCSNHWRQSHCVQRDGSVPQTCLCCFATWLSHPQPVSVVRMQAVQARHIADQSEL